MAKKYKSTFNAGFESKNSDRKRRGVDIGSLAKAVPKIKNEKRKSKSNNSSDNDILIGYLLVKISKKDKNKKTDE